MVVELAVLWHRASKSSMEEEGVLERGRAAPKERRSHVSWAAQTSTIYRGGGGCAPFRVSTPKRRRPALDPIQGGAAKGRRGGALGWASRPIWT